MHFSEQVRLIKSSKQVHSRWYLETYPEVAALGLDPAEHYLRYGAAMGRNPGKTFDTRFYLETYPEVAESGLNPLVHYILHGQAKGYERRPPKNQARRQIDIIRTKLLSLGFTERPLAELNAIADQSPDPEARALAARELALWHMREKTEAGWRLALDHIARARADAPDLAFRAKLATAELLCHYHLGDAPAGLAAYDRAALAGEATPDVMLARANLQPAPESRLAWINATLARYAIEPVSLLPDEGQPPYDRLTCAPLPAVTGGPKVTVLVAAYESAAMLPTALRSLQAQTWTNLEIIVIDDASPTSDTAAVAERFAAADPRIRVIRMAENGGAYVARNRGLDEATGEFVTLHDADDWSHPKKIETQVRFMIENPSVMGCTSEQARCRMDLEFSRWTGSGVFINKNVSSLLWRREPVRAELGYWDTVRFAADSEFIRRMERVFGKRSIVEMKGGPYSFQRDSETSIIADDVMGMNGFYFGARKEYFDAQRFHHNSGRSLRYTNDRKERPFPAPVIMLPDRKERAEDRHFDVVHAGDFRSKGEATLQLMENIEDYVARGLRVGIIECPNYDASECDGMTQVASEVRSLIDSEKVRLIVFGETWYIEKSIVSQSETINPDNLRYFPMPICNSMRENRK